MRVHALADHTTQDTRQKVHRLGVVKRILAPDTGSGGPVQRTCCYLHQDFIITVARNVRDCPPKCLKLGVHCVQFVFCGFVQRGAGEVLFSHTQ